MNIESKSSDEREDNVSQASDISSEEDSPEGKPDSKVLLTALIKIIGPILIFVWTGATIGNAYYSIETHKKIEELLGQNKELLEKRDQVCTGLREMRHTFLSVYGPCSELIKDEAAILVLKSHCDLDNHKIEQLNKELEWVRWAQSEGKCGKYQ